MGLLAPRGAGSQSAAPRLVSALGGHRNECSQCVPNKTIVTKTIHGAVGRTPPSARVPPDPPFHAGRRGRRPRTRGSAPLCVQDVFEGVCRYCTQSACVTGGFNGAPPR